jgi:pimeloyl-ACP methyl ester carboxylesterase
LREGIVAGSTVDLNGMTMYFERHGEGEPLLFMHGGMGAGDNWTYIFPTVPEGFGLIAPDQRGHGASTNPSNRFTFAQVAADTFALLDHLHVDRVKAIGVSGGGIALLHMATAQPSRIASMAIVSAPPYFPAQARAIQARFTEAMLPEAERAALRRRCVHGEAQVRALFEYAQGFATDYDDVAFTPPRLATITASTLIVFGDRDFLYPVSLAFDLHTAIPKSYLWVVPNGPHGPVFGPHAPRFAETSLAFLRGEWP